MEKDPLRRGTVTVAPIMALAIGAASLSPNPRESLPTPEVSYSADGEHTDQEELRSMREQFIAEREALVAQRRAQASRSRTAPTDVPKRKHVRHTVVYASMAKDLHDLGQCESGGNPRTNTGNGYYGEYQFDLRTWFGNGYDKYASRPDLATEAEQTAATRDLQSKRGWNPWPACARKLGLFTHRYVEQD